MKKTYEMIHDTIREIVEENKSHTPREIFEILDEEIAVGELGELCRDDGWNIGDEYTFGEELGDLLYQINDELRDIVFDIVLEAGVKVVGDFEKEHNIDLGFDHREAVENDIYAHFDEWEKEIWDMKIEDFYKIYYDWTYEWHKERMLIVLEEEEEYYSQN